MIDQIRSDHFPAHLDEEVMVTAVSSQTFNEVTGQLYSQIFTPLTDLGLHREPPPQSSLSRELARHIHTEYFVFYNEAKEPVGFSTGTLTDEQTFFMVWSGILPAYQRRGLYTRFLDRLLPYLKALGVERVTSNHMGNNRPVLIAKLKAGFNVTGITLDERWGMQVWLTCYLAEARQQGFEHAFSLDRF